MALSSVIDDIGVGQVMYHQYIVLFGQGHHALEEVQLHALGGRVGREAEDHHLRFRDRLADRALQLVEEIDAGHQRYRTHLGASDHCAVDVDRVARVGHQHGVAVVEGAEHQVCQALFGADGDDGFAFRVDIDLVAFLVPVGDGPAQARNAAGGGVAWVSSRWATCTSFSTMCGGVAPSGLPMLRSMMSSPRRRAAILSSAVMLKT